MIGDAVFPPCEHYDKPQSRPCPVVTCPAGVRAEEWTVAFGDGSRRVFHRVKYTHGGLGWDSGRFIPAPEVTP